MLITAVPFLLLPLLALLWWRDLRTRVTPKPVITALAVGLATLVSLSKADTDVSRSTLPLYKTIPAAATSDLTPAGSPGSKPNGGRTWARSNADAANSRYSALTQINRDNVRQLQVAWMYHSGDGPGYLEVNPIVVGGVLYTPTVGQNFAAIDAATGKELWRQRLFVGGVFFDPDHHKAVVVKPNEPTPANYRNIGFGPATRGLTYWNRGAQGRPRLFFMANGYLLCLDPRTGERIESFGSQGRVASSKGPGASAFLGAVAPAIFENTIVAPNQNVVDAFDIKTGRRLWTFNTVTYPVANTDEDTGANIWGGIALDESRGLAFMATGDPHPNLVGIGRPGPDLYANSVLALDVRTGKLRWAFQHIGHDIWDLDTPAPPNLVTVSHAGKRVDAVAEVTKLGSTLLLDRVTGKPLFPYRLRRAPSSTIPGETTSPYQPDVELPQPFARQVFSADDVTDLSPEAHDFVLKQLRNAHFGWFEPLHLSTPTVYYGIHGGAEWTGAAFDPESAYLYVTANELAFVETLVPQKEELSKNMLGPGEDVFLHNCAFCHGKNREGQGVVPSLLGLKSCISEEEVRGLLKTGRNGMPPMPLSENELHDLINFLFDKGVSAPASAKTDKAVHDPSFYGDCGFHRLLDDHGYPGTKPPWGTLNAINLNTGKLVWKVPLGEYAELTERGVRPTGTENFGGATVTAGGVVFAAGTRDHKIRAFDKTNGKELWSYELPYGGYAPPAVYEVSGREYVVIAATSGGKLGGETGDMYVAFSLPQRDKP